MAGTIGTSGSDGVTNKRRAWALTAVAIAALAVAKAAVNASSMLDEHARSGDVIAAWRPWALEGTSLVAWLCVMPLLALLVVWLKAHLRWPAIVAIIAVATVPVSLLHVGLMVGLRHLIYGMMGESYRLANTVFGGLVYEWRKDAVDTLMLAATFASVDWLTTSTTSGTGTTERIEVRDGTRTTFVDPADVRWVEAAGNYVELHTGSATLLHRATLAEIERLLEPHGLVRIHRSRLVRREAVKRIDNRPSGDFEAWLDDATAIGGSRRYRSALDAG